MSDPSRSPAASPDVPPDTPSADDTVSEADALEAALQYTPIHAWDPSDQPREKLMKHGARHLSDAELLAILLGSGTRTGSRKLSAVDLGKALLKLHTSLDGLAQRAVKELTRVTGVGPAKATKLRAAFEIGRRVEAQRHDRDRVQVCSPEDVAAVYGPQMRDLKKEIFKVVHLNTANVIIGDYDVSEGGLAASIVEPRAVFEKAILDNAASVICLHNHPSGNPEPSRQDIRITRQLVDAGKLMGIPVHDHLIIAGTTHTSLAARGVID